MQHTVAQDHLYRTYHYRSGVNEMMVAELRSIVAQAQGLVPLSAQDLVLDIGANDGTLLAQYALQGQPPRRLAVEPALNLQATLSQHCEQWTSDYFPTSMYDRYAGQIKVITAIAMAYDLEDPVGFFEAVRALLHPEGICIVQFQDFGQMRETNAFDNIVPEHLEYYTLHTLQHIVRKAGLEPVHCLTTPINGGSLRVVLRPASWVMRRGVQHGIDTSVYAQLEREAQQGLTPSEVLLQGRYGAFTTFAANVRRVQDQIHATVQGLLEQGCRLDVYGASTKGNVLLQILGLGPEQVRQAIDRSPEKAGLHTVTGISIVNEADGEYLPAPAWLIPIWQFRESVLRRNQWYLEGGGSMIFPLPSVEIIQGSWSV
jgi:hypothetical protein